MKSTNINDICEVKVSKAGENLFAKIPIRYMDIISRGDKVKITLIEKAPNEKIIPLLKKFIQNPNGSKLKGSIEGYNISIPIAKIIELIGEEKAEQMFMEAIR